MILFVCLTSGVVKLRQIEDAADFLLGIMPLTFIPIGAKILTLLGELRAMLAPFLIAAFVTTAVVIAATGRSTQWLVRKRGGDAAFSADVEG